MITGTEVRNLTQTSNIDPKLFEVQIEIAQLRYLKPAIGKDFYDQLVVEVDTTFSGLNETLWNSYLKKALAFYTAYESLPNIKSEVTNLGVKMWDNEFTEEAPEKNYAYLRQQFQKAGDLYTAEGREYIEDNMDSFPLYKCFTEIEYENSNPIHYTGKGEY